VPRRFALRSLAGAGLAATGLGTYGLACERHHFAVTRTTVHLRHLPPGLAGLRLGLISDIH
jgi:predicted MPP superfamily phosphohydrolase